MLRERERELHRITYILAPDLFMGEKLTFWFTTMYELILRDWITSKEKVHRSIVYSFHLLL